MRIIWEIIVWQNRSWVSFHTIETRLDADKEGGGDKLTSATSEAVFLPFL